MEIKIGVQETSRELILSSTKSTDELDGVISEALGSDEGILRLTDDKGRRFVIPTAKIAYIELTPAEVRKVGFAAEVTES